MGIAPVAAQEGALILRAYALIVVLFGLAHLILAGRSIAFHREYAAMIPRTKVNYRLPDLMRACLVGEDNNRRRETLTLRLGEIFDTSQGVVDGFRAGCALYPAVELAAKSSVGACLYLQSCS